MEASCLVSFVLFFVSDVLHICSIYRFIQHRPSDGGNKTYSDMKNLDVDFIQAQWEDRSKYRTLEDATSIFTALAWFSLCIPILQVSWILSSGGRVRIVSHVLICVLAIATSMCELITSLMLVGFKDISVWVSNAFNLDAWGTCTAADCENEEDMIGWKVLEIVYFVNRGMLLWMNAFEWICLFGILTLIFFSVRAEHKNLREGAVTFGKKWAALGLVIGILGLFEFVADILRFQSWRLFVRVSFGIAVVNTLILLPIWFIVLGRQLTNVRLSFERRSETEVSLMRSNESEIEMN